MAAKKTTTATKKFKEDEIDGDVLLELKTAGATGAYIAAAQGEVLVHFEYATVDLTKSNTDGNIAAWITEAGVKYFDENYDPAEDAPAGTGVADTVASSIVGTDFVIRTDVPVPTSKRGFSARGNKYPFDALPVGGSFHIKATAAKPKPSASFASTVTSANKRQEEAKTGKKFIVRSVGPDDPDGLGARIYRQT